MSTLPTAMGNDGGEADTTAGQHGLAREDTICGWVDQRFQYAHLNRLQGGTGMPYASVAVVPPMALYGAALAPGGNHDPLSQYYAYCQQQRLTAFNHHHVRAAIPRNSSQQTSEVQRTRLQQPPHAQHGVGGVPPVNIGGYLDLLARSHAQEQQSRELETTNQVIHLETAPPRAESLGGSLQEAMKRRITEKIKEKLRKLKPNMNESNHAAALEPFIREEKPHHPPRNELNNGTGQIIGLVDTTTPINSRRDSSRKRPSVTGEKTLVPPPNFQPHAKRPSVSGEAPSSPSPKFEPQLKKRKTGGTTTKKQPAAPAQIADCLDEAIDSLQDENIRSALQEDRENLRAKRSEMREMYDEQIREAMKSRLAMYTKLQIFARQILSVRSKSISKNSRSSNHMDGAIDMIHLGLRNYRMLEDMSDRLLGAISKMNGEG
ncbi:hypothetical protein ACHAXA_010695 [Cyclostephanos tholiformis]|uniref:Uncharacterized protein n=1 Tax=Cyclostephanos tholiformis TaxID=382380 RepID=A0ABD3SEP3_9STRA